MFELSLIPITGVLPVSHNELGPPPTPVSPVVQATAVPTLGMIPETGTPPPMR